MSSNKCTVGKKNKSTKNPNDEGTKRSGNSQENQKQCLDLVLQPCLALVVIPSQKDACLHFDVAADLLHENEDEHDKNDEDNEVFTWLHETKTIKKDFLTNKKMSELFLFDKDKEKMHCHLSSPIPVLAYHVCKSLGLKVGKTFILLPPPPLPT